MTEFEKKVEDWKNTNLEHAKNVAELIQNSSPEHWIYWQSSAVSAKNSPSNGKVNMGGGPD